MEHPTSFDELREFCEERFLYASKMMGYWNDGEHHDQFSEEYGKSLAFREVLEFLKGELR